jgi:hypothetical protein
MAEIQSTVDEFIQYYSKGLETPLSFFEPSPPPPPFEEPDPWENTPEDAF